MRNLTISQILSVCFIATIVAVSLYKEFVHDPYQKQMAISTLSVEQAFGVKARITDGKLFLYEEMTEECPVTPPPCTTYEQILLVVPVDTSRKNASHLADQILEQQHGIRQALARAKESVKFLYKSKQQTPKE
ncbi:hypothetical protein [Bdellovibrio sp. BCCA]|uniref:hypothetical protein n=1 Tax=Bdellovibrio sp. BCCA TaxID=3136281 RepID=UPI0030F2EEB1